MQPPEYRWHLVLAVMVAGTVTVISIAEGSLLGGLALSLGVLLVAAGLLAGVAFFARSGHLRADVASAGSGTVGAGDVPAGEDEGTAGAVSLGRFASTWRLARSRPWRAGAGVLPVATRAIEGRPATLVSPRGHRIAAPHLLFEFNPADLREATDRWPADLLAAEYAAGYVEHAQHTGLKRVAEQTIVSIAATERVPVGRVYLTPGFAGPARLEPAARASVANGCTPLVAGPDPAEQPDEGAQPGVPAQPGAERSALPGRTEHAEGPDDRTGVPPAAVDHPRLRPGMAPLDAPFPGAVLTPLEVPGPPIELRPPTTELGRTVETGPLADPAVSRRHVRLSHGGQGWTVTDLGSTNGVFVNGRRLARGLLTEGDVLGLGAGGPRLRLDRLPYDRPATATARPGSAHPEAAPPETARHEAAPHSATHHTPAAEETTRRTERTVELV